MNRLRNGSIAVGTPGSAARIAAEAADNLKCSIADAKEDLLRAADNFSDDSPATGTILIRAAKEYGRLKRLAK